MQRNPFCYVPSKASPRASMDRFAPGDQLFFAGDDPLSRAIAKRTANWKQWLGLGLPMFSHVGICAEVEIQGERPQIWLFESTTLCTLPCLMQQKPVSGVQAHPPAERVKEYPGSVWRLRLRQPISEEENSTLSDFLRGEVGKPYDRARAVLLASWHGWAASLVDPSPDAWFCSELAGEGLKRIKRFGQLEDPAELTPNSLALRQMHAGNLWPIEQGGQSRRLK